MTLPEQTNTRWRLVLLFCVPLAFSLVFFLITLATERAEIHLLEVRNISSSIKQLQDLVIEAENGERGFLLTGNERYLVPLQHASGVLPSQVSICRSYIRDRPALRSQIEEITSLVQERFRESNQILEIQRTQGFAAALNVAKSGLSEDTMNHLRLSVNDLRTKLDREETAYLDSQRWLTRWTFVFFLVGTLIMIAISVWLYYEFVSYLHARDAAHSELRDLNIALEARIEERTRDLTRANEELQQFAYVASHDLQEPLRTIMSFSQLLAHRYQGRLDEDADEFISYIVSSSRRMTDLINGLLALVRLRRSGQPTVPVRFEELLQEAEVSLQAAIRESGTQIVHESLPALVVDRVQFAQVLQNLISNAIKYRRDEAPFIRIEAHRKESDWIFSVADNGRGFNQQFSERIFGLFQRLHSREVEGTGMGLSIARKILERHGGRIWAESTEGLGSTFFFSLPVSLEVSREGNSQTVSRN